MGLTTTGFTNPSLSQDDGQLGLHSGRGHVRRIYNTGNKYADKISVLKIKKTAAFTLKPSWSVKKSSGQISWPSMKSSLK